jgi:hypothetical protein
MIAFPSPFAMISFLFGTLNLGQCDGSFATKLVAPLTQ